MDVTVTFVLFLFRYFLLQNDLYSNHKKKYSKCQKFSHLIMIRKHLQQSYFSAPKSLLTVTDSEGCYIDRWEKKYYETHQNLFEIQIQFY